MPARCPELFYQQLRGLSASREPGWRWVGGAGTLSPAAWRVALCWGRGRSTSGTAQGSEGLRWPRASTQSCRPPPRPAGPQPTAFLPSTGLTSAPVGWGQSRPGDHLGEAPSPTLCFQHGDSAPEAAPGWGGMELWDFPPPSGGGVGLLTWVLKLTDIISPAP